MALYLNAIRFITFSIMPQSFLLFMKDEKTKLVPSIRLDIKKLYTHLSYLKTSGQYSMFYGQMVLTQVAT